MFLTSWFGSLLKIIELQRLNTVIMLWVECMNAREMKLHQYTAVPYGEYTYFNNILKSEMQRLNHKLSAMRFAMEALNDRGWCSLNTYSSPFIPNSSMLWNLRYDSNIQTSDSELKHILYWVFGPRNNKHNKIKNLKFKVWKASSSSQKVNIEGKQVFIFYDVQ